MQIWQPEDQSNKRSVSQLFTKARFCPFSVVANLSSAFSNLPLPNRCFFVAALEGPQIQAILDWGKE